MAPVYINDFHRQNSLACKRDLRSSAQRLLSVDDVLAQSRRFGRSSAQPISSLEAVGVSSRSLVCCSRRACLEDAGRRRRGLSRPGGGRCRCICCGASGGYRVED